MTLLVSLPSFLGARTTPEDPLVVWSFVPQITIPDGAAITIQRVRQHTSPPAGQQI